jgi:hypothetical protein
MLNLKLPEKQEQAKPQASRKREIIKIRAEIYEIQTKRKKKAIQSINEMKSWFIEKINKLNKSLANMTKMRKEKTQINKIRNEREEIVTNIKKKKSRHS